jgi:inhibitor of cysteine peptidase
MTVGQNARGLLLFFLVVFVITGCSALTSEEATEPAPAETPSATADSGDAETPAALVEEIEVLMLESFPVQVNVIASGNLPDGCTSLNEPTPRREGNTFVVNLTTTRVDEICTQALVPFDKVIPLEVEGLPAGTYTVSVNGLTETFTLDVDNVAQEEPTDTPSGTDGGGINGVVWHDLCAVAGGEGGEPAVPSDGCVALDDGSYQANGVLEAEEPGIEDVVVELGEGACPASGLETVTTNGDGAFAFTGLSAGTYCVTVDALQEENSEILIPGDWTSPSTEEGAAMVEVNVTDGEISSDINFGWDYQFLPEAEGEGSSAEKDCTDSATFVADLTVQDNEVLPPGFVFTKTWRLQNNGTCVWNSDYDLVFVGGDQMSAPDEIPLAQDVAENGIIDLSVLMVAPELNGTYRGNWMVQNELGDRFGIPEAFWLQIVVESAIPEEGGYINGLVWSDVCTVGEDDTASAGCVEAEEGGFRADGDLAGDEPRIEGVTVALGAGACPTSTITTTDVTGEDGRYSFTGLDAGTYCVFIDELAAANEAILIPGQWTVPEVGVETASITVDVEDSVPVSGVNFGWDYQAD